ncbi:hypothetical protein N7470_008474 [Penicillium chermesinum]|nr:hypothetical protein N7470_008474 [Penicillium chermesinum]
MASSKLPSYWEQTELESSSKGSHECLPAYSERTPTTEQNSSDQSSCGKWTSVKGAIWSYIKEVTGSTPPNKLLIMSESLDSVWAAGLPNNRATLALHAAVVTEPEPAHTGNGQGHFTPKKPHSVATPPLIALFFYPRSFIEVVSNPSISVNLYRPIPAPRLNPSSDRRACYVAVAARSHLRPTLSITITSARHVALSPQEEITPLILADMAPPYDELLARRRLGKTNLSVKPGQVGTSNATKPENLGLFDSQQHPETYFLMRRSKDGFVSATGMFKIAFPWAKAEEERLEREYLKSREYTSLEEVAGNVWISPEFALELSEEYQMKNWFELPMDDPEPTPSQRRSRRSVSPSKKSTSPRKARQPRTAKEAPSTPSTTAANENLQKALEVTASNVDSDIANGVLESVEEVEIVESTTTPKKPAASPEKKGRKSKKEKAEDEKEEKKEKKEDKKTEKKKKEVKDKEVGKEAAEEPTTTISLELPTSLLPEGPSAADTEEMLAKAKKIVKEAVSHPANVDAEAAKASNKRKPEDDDEETAAEAASRVKKAKVLEEKLKRERVRNRALLGVSAAFAIAASIPYFF